MRLRLSRRYIVRGSFRRSWERCRCTVWLVSCLSAQEEGRKSARVERIRESETYEFKGDTAGLRAANGNVEEDARALWIQSACVIRRHPSSELSLKHSVAYWSPPWLLN